MGADSHVAACADDSMAGFCLGVIDFRLEQVIMTSFVGWVELLLSMRDGVFNFCAC